MVVDYLADLIDLSNEYQYSWLLFHRGRYVNMVEKSPVSSLCVLLPSMTLISLLIINYKRPPCLHTAAEAAVVTVLEFLTRRSVADFKQFINSLSKEQAYLNKTLGFHFCWTNKISTMADAEANDCRSNTAVDHYSMNREVCEVVMSHEMPSNSLLPCNLQPAKEWGLHSRQHRGVSRWICAKSLHLLAASSHSHQICTKLIPTLAALRD